MWHVQGFCTEVTSALNMLLSVHIPMICDVLPIDQFTCWLAQQVFLLGSCFLAIVESAWTSHHLCWWYCNYPLTLKKCTTQQDNVGKINAQCRNVITIPDFTTLHTLKKRDVVMFIKNFFIILFTLSHSLNLYGDTSFTDCHFQTSILDLCLHSLIVYGMIYGCKGFGL